MVVRAKWDPALHPRSGLGRFVSIDPYKRRMFEPDPGLAQSQRASWTDRDDNSEDIARYYDPGTLLSSGQRPELDLEAEAALVDYTERPWINMHTRHGLDDSEGRIPTRADWSRSMTIPEYTAALDRAVDAGSLLEDTNVYRGLATGGLSEAQMRAWESIKPGDQVLDRGFMSTTLDPDVIRDFGTIEIEIELPRGTRVAMSGLYSEMYESQRELLVGRGSVLEIVSVERGARIDEMNVRARLVGYLDD